ncbi:MAG: PH domain-containing protein [Syntrophomonas sp.]|nr:PH domain-containing protein [Syntrophomonas sp.]
MYEPQRLHPLAILDFFIHKIYTLVQALLPLLVLAIAEAGSRKWLLLAIPFILLLFIAYGILYWLRYVFYIKGQELRMESGVLIRKKRYIPFERIQTIQITAGILQRLFGLVKIQVETAGGGAKAEFVLAALSRQKAEELSRIIQANKRIAPTNCAETTPIEYSLSTRSLLLLASTSNGIGVALAALLAVVSQFDDVFSNMHIWVKLGTYVENIAAGKVSLIILLIFVLLFLAWLMSLLGTIIRFAGFRMVRDNDNIKISRGLLERQQITIPLRRIQAIKVIEGILRQPLGMVSIQVVSVSNIGTKGEGNLIVPLLPKAQLISFLEETLPEFAMSLQVQGLPDRSKKRYYLINTLPVIIIAIISSIFIPMGYLAFSLLPLAAWLGKQQYQDAGWQVDNDKLLMRSRRLGRITTIIHRRRIQSLCISRNFFQERQRLNSLAIAFASGIAGARAKIRGMDSEKSNTIVSWFIQE